MRIELLRTDHILNGLLLSRFSSYPQNYPQQMPSNRMDDLAHSLVDESTVVVEVDAALWKLEHFPFLGDHIDYKVRLWRKSADIRFSR